MSVQRDPVWITDGPQVRYVDLMCFLLNPAFRPAGTAEAPYTPLACRTFDRSGRCTTREEGPVYLHTVQKNILLSDVIDRNGDPRVVFQPKVSNGVRVLGSGLITVCLRFSRRSPKTCTRNSSPS